jgi:hypothetical protein
MNTAAIKAYNEAIEKQLRERVQEILSSHKMPYDFEIDSQSFIKITVVDGDWKHDHLRLKWLMEENDFKHFGENVTEEDGSDCYSAIHTFIYLGDEY